MIVYTFRFTPHSILVVIQKDRSAEEVLREIAHRKRNRKREGKKKESVTSDSTHVVRTCGIMGHHSA